MSININRKSRFYLHDMTLGNPTRSLAQ